MIRKFIFRLKGTNEAGVRFKTEILSSHIRQLKSCSFSRYVNR